MRRTSEVCAQEVKPARFEGVDPSPRDDPTWELWPQLSGRIAGFGGRRRNCVDRAQEKDPSPSRRSCPIIYSLARRFITAARGRQVTSARRTAHTFICSALPSEVGPDLEDIVHIQASAAR